MAEESAAPGADKRTGDRRRGDDPDYAGAERRVGERRGTRPEPPPADPPPVR